MKKRFVAVIAVMFLGPLLAGSSAGAQSDVLCDGKPVTIFGTAGDDNILGTVGDDVIFAMQGDDWINGSGGDDVICAGQGDDTIIGGKGFDIMFGAQGDDVIFSAAYSIAGNAPDTRGARMFGGAGNDIIFGSDRWDRMQGGPGADQLWGYDGQDWMRGGADMDEVYGGNGTDDVHGGNGSDRITVDRGDTVKGGAGSDWCVVTGQATAMKSCGTNGYEAVPNERPLSLRAGTYNVGPQARAGFYRTSDYYDVMDANGVRITNGYSGKDGVMSAIVAPWAATVEFDAPAVRVDSSTVPVNPFIADQGTYFVGIDVAPGNYRVVPSDRYPGSSIIINGLHNTVFSSDATTDGTSSLVIPPEAIVVTTIGRLERID